MPSFGKLGLATWHVIRTADLATWHQVAKLGRLGIDKDRPLVVLVKSQRVSLLELAATKATQDLLLMVKSPPGGNKSNVSPSAGGNPAPRTSVYLGVPTGGAGAVTSVYFGVGGAGPVGTTPGNYFASPATAAGGGAPVPMGLHLPADADASASTSKWISNAFAPFVFKAPSKMWYELLRFFSRKELVILQFGNRFFAKAIRDLKLPALHFIARLAIGMINLPNMGIFCFVGTGVNEKHPSDTFCPPSYVRFSKIILTTLVIDGDFMERLKKHKITFTNCAFVFFKLNVHEEPANEAMKTLMEDVFTECTKVNLYTKGWTSAKQLNLCTLPGVYKCNTLSFDGDKMVLITEDPIFESMIEWLHSSRGSTEKCIFCEALRKFVDDVECHTYVLGIFDLQEDFLHEFADFSAANTTTGEHMLSYANFDDVGGSNFALTSSSSGSSWCSKPIGLLRFRRSGGGGAASKPGIGGGSKPAPGTSVYFAAPSGGAGGAPGVTSCYFAPK
ncbi:hypothetical protein DdX_15244 [Ditylenchus destructor]|uniref:Uncharacterized protein n=1 Tax=Ditylenchus destructor TaxID=166010 RepID=A0AAD4MVQ1_9BILA|nr:hypothetical protein DdX_15244 [Ditylenchus destructor]